MTAKLDYAWKLREVMATRGLFQTTHLRPRLAERGIHLSDSQVYRLVTDKPERLNLKVLMALLDILGCRMDDLIEPVAAPAATLTISVDIADEFTFGVRGFAPKLQVSGAAG